jgi:hypothetical protein
MIFREIGVELGLETFSGRVMAAVDFEAGFVCRNCRQVVSVCRFGAGAIFRSLRTLRIADALTR